MSHAPARAAAATAFVQGALQIEPRGLKGGTDAAAGRNWVERADGSVEMLTATDWAKVDVGDHFIIETPGGGGFGREGE